MFLGNAVSGRCFCAHFQGNAVSGSVFQMPREEFEFRGSLFRDSGSAVADSPSGFRVLTLSSYRKSHSTTVDNYYS